MEQVLRADERRGQELQLCSLLDRVLINLFVKLLLLLISRLQLAVDAIEILHVFGVALFLIPQRLLLAR